MLPLNERLQGVVSILEESNMELQSPKADATGFIPALPDLLADAVLRLLEHAGTSSVSLDIGCGNGGWTLLAAAAGFPSYGVEISPFLLDAAQRNYELAVTAGYIDAATPCVFVLGDMIPARYSKDYDSFRASHTQQERSMPVGAVVTDVYSRLPVSIRTADIIYCWAWPTQSRFVFNMLDAEAKKDAIMVLPSYERYTKGDFLKAVPGKNTLDLMPLAVVKAVYIGRRAGAALKEAV